ncbi:MAG: HAD hydrolase-like protein [Bacillota bacterium]|nr:HAD hydrolase-like protein [Bacillota bacterium]
MKRIVWDWNGTLFDDLNVSYDCVNKLLIKYEQKELQGIHHYKDIFGFPIEEYYKKAGFDFSKNSYRKLAHEYMDDYMNRSLHCSLQKDSLEALKFVKEQGMKQVILSASKKDYLLEQVNRFDINGYIDELYGISNIYAKSKVDLAKQIDKRFSRRYFLFHRG